jgi:hypothetical protein
LNIVEEDPVTESAITTFTSRHFGEYAAACKSAFVAAGIEAHLRSLDAKVASRLKSNHSYGSTFWLALPEEVVSRLLTILPGAIAIPLKGAQYQLLVWNDIAILPVKILEAGNSDVRLRARVSDLRTRLTQINGPAPQLATLFDGTDGEVGLDDLADEARNFAEAARAYIGNIATKMVVAAYGCNPKSGLQVICVGIATLDGDGTIHYTDSEQLSVDAPADTASTLKAVAGQTFDAAPRPQPRLEAVRYEQTATGEEGSAAHHDVPRPE